MYYYTYLVIPTNEKSRLFGTVYFGQHRTKNLNDNYIASGKKIRDYLKKYPNDYYREIIKFYSSEEELNKAEFDLINPYLGKEYCLNFRDGGNVGIFTDEYRKKLSESHIGKKLKPFTDEHKKKLSLAARNRKPISDETRKKISNAVRSRKPMSDETRKKISKSLIGKNIGKTPWDKGIKRSDEFRKKLSDSRKGIKILKENFKDYEGYIKHLSESNKKAWTSELRQKHSALLKGKKYRKST